jgi:hypothetical protein
LRDENRVRQRWRFHASPGSQTQIVPDPDGERSRKHDRTAPHSLRAVLCDCNRNG